MIVWLYPAAYPVSAVDVSVVLGGLESVTMWWDTIVHSCKVFERVVVVRDDVIYGVCALTAA